MKKDYAVYYVSLKVLLRENDEFLFLKSADKKFFDLPGGRIEKGENYVSLERMLDREMKEEIGRKVKYKLDNPIFTSRRYLRKKKKYIFTLVYSAEYLSGEIKLSPEHSGYEWINPKNYQFKEKDFINKEEYLAFKKYFESLQAAPQLKFIYSLPYDRMLTEYRFDIFNERQTREVKKYIKKLQIKWNKINDSAFRILEELVGNKWQEKELKCYVVKNCKYSGISEPLTVRMENDFDYVFDTLVHELLHILISYDFRKYKKVETKIKEMFPGIKDQRILRHIYVNFIELKALREIFSSKAIERIMKRAKKFKIGKAYEIVLKNEKALEDSITTI